MARKSASDIAKQYLRLRSMPHSLNRSFTLNKAYTNALKARGMSRMGVKTANGLYDYNKKREVAANKDTKAKKERFYRYLQRHKSHVIKTEKGLVST